jgi:hypothetical protein
MKRVGSASAEVARTRRMAQDLTMTGLNIQSSGQLVQGHAGPGKRSGFSFSQTRGLPH